MTATTIFLPDLQLVKLALKDRKFEETILRRLYPRIARIVKIAAGNQFHCDDITQLAAMQVVKSLKWYKGLGSLESWADRITYRTAMKFLKQKRNAEVGHVPLFDDDVVSKETPERYTARRQVFDMLLDKLQRIPEKRRAPLLLHVAMGYTVREISEMTDISQNTIKAQLKTAFREFQVILDENPKLVDTLLEEA